jgi:hypothetical protein
MYMPEAFERPATTTEVSRQLRFIGYSTAALVLVLSLLVAGLFLLRDRDRDRQQAVDRAALTYLCRTVAIQNVLLVQQIGALRLELVAGDLGPNERERTRGRLAALEVLHAELSDQRPCQEVQ